MIKLAANAFLMTRISFINEIANVCEVTGADVVKVAEGVGLDNRLGPHFLRAGDRLRRLMLPEGLARAEAARSNSGYHFQLLSAVIEVNELQKRRVIGKLTRHLGSLRGKKVALLGLAFKPNTDDMREAPSIVLAKRLLAEGAEVRGWDPVADGTELPQRRRDRRLGRWRRCAGADAAVIVTEWAELRELATRGDARSDGEPADHRRAQPARPAETAGGRASPTRGSAGRVGGDVFRRRPTRAVRRLAAWRRSSWRAARPSAWATRPAAGRRRSSTSRASRSPRTRSRGSRRRGSAV